MTTAARKWLPLFMNFIDKIVIDSKETGVGKLIPYGSQTIFLEEICEGLDRGIRHFVCLKARQLGMSTIGLGIDLFWLFIHKGLQGALVTDTEENREKFRIIITRIIESLPATHRVGVKKHNRSNLVLENGSVLDYVVAGTRKGKGGLGRSRAWNFVHATECSSYADAEGLDSMVASLARDNPNRLYIFESTARGFNVFWDMWEKAGADAETQKRFFIGWWAKDGFGRGAYTIPEEDARFAKYMSSELDDGESEKVAEVKKLYGYTVSQPQIAWHRWYSQTQISTEAMMDQEYPWTEDQAFVMTGQSFFPQRRLAEETKRIYQAVTFKGYRYHLVEDFRATEMEQVSRAADAELRIWEEPDVAGIYSIGFDPAFGSNEWKDRHAMQVLRCYADRVVQVAEYASANPQTYQATWVLAHMAGAYRNCMINLEINGPGGAIMTELRHLKNMLMGGYLQIEAAALPTAAQKEPVALASLKFAEKRSQNWADVFANVRWYLYNKPDSMGAGYMYNWKCLALDTPLPTPTGWTTMGDVEAGDYLLDDRGQPCLVTGVSPVKINNPCYQIVFDDGTNIEADAEHLWSVHRHIDKCWKGVEKLRKTSELMPGKHVIRVADPLVLPDVELPIHPYVLGVWLGDGTSAAGSFWASPADMPEISKNLVDAGVLLGDLHTYKGVCQRTILGLGPQLRSIGVLGDKHIPDQYLRASFEQRLALLQGLMDTDGSSGGNGGRQCSFTTSNEMMAMGFTELVTTLGFKSKHCVRNRVLKYAGGLSVCSPAYQFWFTPSNDASIFRLFRKQSKISVVTGPRHKTWHRITAVEPIESVPVKCVMVDSPSHLYLAGLGMVPTHNTNTDNKMMIMNQLRDQFALKALEINSMPCLEEMLHVVQDGVVIEAQGRAKDDRVFALALANHAYLRWLRPSLVSNGETYEKATAQAIQVRDKPQQTMTRHVVSEFFKEQDQAREDREVEAMWQ